MNRISIEIKARCHNPAGVRQILRGQKAVYKGLDHQIDTYFCVPTGRLKLRKGNIENALIYYKRTDQKNSKRCDAILCKLSKQGRFSAREPSLTVLKKLLSHALGILTVVDKKREIYFIRNTKFHIDQVRGLGKFVEIEVFGPAKQAIKLKARCEYYQQLLGVKKRDLIADSYSDQLLRKNR
ncbi:MAG TPA: class IV adenylate cyclase [Candidatus Omnitrophota bacterium]|nr:class IV adenylate cyclase [Candidatus Omnitrophota bacterium]